MARGRVNEQTRSTDGSGPARAVMPLPALLFQPDQRPPGKDRALAASFAISSGKSICCGVMEWCPGPESNQRHCDFQSHALPTELPGHFACAGNRQDAKTASYRRGGGRLSSSHSRLRHRGTANALKCPRADLLRASSYGLKCHLQANCRLLHRGSSLR